EEAGIHSVWQRRETTARLIDGRSGVWERSTIVTKDPAASHRDRKVAALGIRIPRELTMHGLELNCDTILDYSEHMSACGLDDADITTLALELGRDFAVDDAVEPLLIALDDALAGRMVVADHTFASAPDPIKLANEKARQARAQSSLADHAGS